ncbi:hypothetical protein HDV00_009519 [Rhizophlyctis rosea]|nr:hypothetical protein HDV00_009519 [Rhizophlyctis rosea]
MKNLVHFYFKFITSSENVKDVLRDIPSKKLEEVEFLLEDWEYADVKKGMRRHRRSLKGMYFGLCIWDAVECFEEDLMDEDEARMRKELGIERLFVSEVIPDDLRR